MSSVSENHFRRLWIGTYPVAGQGKTTGLGEGIWSALLDTRSGALVHARQVCSTPAPSFLATDASTGLVYAVNEEAAGGLQVLQEKGQQLEVVSAVRTGGAHPCHLIVDTASGMAVVAHYSSGSVALVRLDGHGLPATGEPAQIVEFAGSGPDRDRQDASHAHFLLPAPTGATLLVCDLGADCVGRLRVDPIGPTLVDEGIATQLPPGSGPRHAVFSLDGTRLYVLGELDGRLHTLAWDAAAAKGLPLESVPVNPGSDVTPQLSHVTLTGRTLSCSSRRDDVIVQFDLTTDGRPRSRRVLRLPGTWPRHHAMIGAYLVVAQQDSGGVVTLDDTGEVRGHIDIPSPACIYPSTKPAQELSPA